MREIMPNNSQKFGQPAMYIRKKTKLFFEHYTVSPLHIIKLPILEILVKTVIWIDSILLKIFKYNTTKKVT